MAALTGNTVASSYSGLLKTTDNGVLGATEKNLTDGAGNASTLSLGTTSATFTGTLDLQGATVLGVGGGLENGAGTGSSLNSLKVADALVNTPATATSGGDISIGENARTLAPDNFGRSNIALGTNALCNTGSEGSVAIGKNVTAGGSRAVAISEGANAGGTRAISIGQSTSAQNFRSLCIGNYSNARQDASTAIGSSLNAWAQNSIVIGKDSSDADAVRVNSITIGTNINTAQYSVNIGNDQNNYSADSVMIGNSNVIGANYHVMVGYGNNVQTYDNQIAIGRGNTSALADSGVIGYNLTSLWTGGITMNQIALANVANLNYANDTAAATGGVPVGGVYHYDGAMRIRIV